MKNIHVLHEYGARRHYLPHQYLHETGQIHLNHLAPLSTPRAAARNMVDGRWTDAKNKLVESTSLVQLAGMRDQTIILGVAPFNGWVWALEALKRRNRLILFTSWPHWAFGTAVHHPRNWPLAEAWWRFLKDLEVVAVTPGVAQAVSRYGANARVIPHAYDAAEFSPKSLDSKSRLQVLFVGRMVEEKGVAEVLQVAVSRPHIDWLFVGDGPFSKQISDAESTHSNIKNLGYLTGEQLTGAYQRSHLLLLPSKRTPGWEELFGIAIVEAFACGATCIASDNVGPASIIEQDKTGILLSEVSVTSIGNAVDELNADRKRLARLRSSAHTFAQATYEVREVAKLWRDVLNG